MAFLILEHDLLTGSNSKLLRRERSFPNHVFSCRLLNCGECPSLLLRNNRYLLGRVDRLLVVLAHILSTSTKSGWNEASRVGFVYAFETTVVTPHVCLMLWSIAIIIAGMHQTKIKNKGRKHWLCGAKGGIFHWSHLVLNLYTHKSLCSFIATPTVLSTQLSSTAPNATSINKRKQLRGSGSADPVIYLSIRLYLNAAHQSKSVHMRLSFFSQP